MEDLTMKSQEQKIETAITELIDQVERFFNVAPLRFLDIDGGNDDIDCFTFPVEYETRFHRFESWFQNLLETLDPFYGEDEEKSVLALGGDYDPSERPKL
jgi:hypothetical protein